MGRVKISVAGRQSTGAVILHLHRAVAHDLLLALTQALEPHPANTGKLKKNLQKGRSLKGVRLKAKAVKGQSATGKRSTKKSPKGKAGKGKGPKGKNAKSSR